MKISVLWGALVLPLLSSCIVAGVCTNANECRQFEQEVKKNPNKATNSSAGSPTQDGYVTNEQQNDEACQGEGPTAATTPNASQPYNAAYHLMGNWERADKANSLTIDANCGFKSHDCGTEGTLFFVSTSTNATGTTSTTTTGGTNMSGATSATSPAAPTTNPRGVTLVLKVTHAPTQNKLKQNGTCLEQAEYECRHTHTISRLDLECWKKQDDSSNFVGVSGNYSLVQ
jgi:hypothetical protein